MTLLNRLGLCILSDLALAFGFASKGSVLRAIQGCERRAEVDATLRGILRQGMHLADRAA